MNRYYLDFIDKSEVYVAENKDPKWHDKKIYEAVQKFQNLSFFKRFKATRIREMMDQMELTLVPTNEVIFFHKDKVYIMISGLIVM